MNTSCPATGHGNRRYVFHSQNKHSNETFFCLGYSCTESGKSRCYVYSDNTRQWQNNGVGWDRPKRILASLWVNQKYPQQHPTGTWCRPGTDCFPCDPERYFHISSFHYASLISFAADKVHSSDPTFRSFHRQIFHTSLSKIFSSLQPVMDRSEIVQCPDRKYHHGIWGFGSYIGDYLEQTLLACIVQNWCARYVR